LNIEEGFIAERATLTPGSPLWGEHRSRYHFAAPFLKGKRVLDIACGTGFGMRIISESGAKEIFATDMSIDALMTSRGVRPVNAFLFRSDGTQLPFEDGTFDVVTSFETVEHIPNYKDFVADLRRVLKDDGVMIMSTPNAHYTRPVDGKPINPFHIYEFTPEEFRALLEPQFSNVELYGQRVSDDYRICPFWELPDMLPQDPLSRIKIAAWKLQVRLPESLRETISGIVKGRPFFPGENDFVFSPSELKAGYVQVAVCRP
jgi:SAM-dependent methyltransferase